MEVGQWRVPISQLDGSDSQRPDVTAAVIGGVQLLLASDHLQRSRGRGVRLRQNLGRPWSVQGQVCTRRAKAQVQNDRVINEDDPFHTHTQKKLKITSKEFQKWLIKTQVGKNKVLRVKKPDSSNQGYSRFHCGSLLLSNASLLFHPDASAAVKAINTVGISSNTAAIEANKLPEMIDLQVSFLPSMMVEIRMLPTPGNGQEKQALTAAFVVCMSKKISQAPLHM